MKNIIIVLFFLALIPVGGIILQIFLSRRDSKWLGLILPSITFIYSLLVVLNVAALEGMSGGEVFMVIATSFLGSNIPTIILLGIYAACREKLKRRTQLNKMNIQDLE